MPAVCPVLHQHVDVVAQAAVILVLVSVEVSVAAGRVGVAVGDMWMLHDLISGFLVSLGCYEFLQSDDGTDYEGDFT